MVEKVNPAEPIDCILNIAISEKKTQGSICMNIDPRPYNMGAKHTRYHVTTPQEARHKLKGAKVWGMMMFWPSMIGVHFTSWGEHKPMLPHYNEMVKAAPVRVARHRNKVQDLRFTDKYLPGKSMPCYYTSRHAAPIEDLTEEEKRRLMVDVGEDIQVMRVIMADLPPALSMEVLREVAERDEVYHKLKAAVKVGKKPKDRDMVPYMAVWEELGWSRSWFAGGRGSSYQRGSALQMTWS